MRRITLKTYKTPEQLNNIHFKTPQYTFEIGETVEIVGNIKALQKTAMRKPYTGRVLAVHGESILVKPKYQRWESTWYRTELRKIGTSKK